MDTSKLKERVLEKTIKSSNDYLLMEELKGSIFSKVEEEEER